MNWYESLSQWKLKLHVLDRLYQQHTDYDPVSPSFNWYLYHNLQRVPLTAAIERNERLTMKRQKKVWHIQSWSFPGIVFRAVWFPVISVDRPTDVQAVRLRSQLKELPEPFLCCWLLSPLYPWLLSNLWPCDVPIQAHSQPQSNTVSWGKNSSCILWVCLCGRDRVYRCKHRCGGTVTDPKPLKSTAAVFTWW